MNIIFLLVHLSAREKSKEAKENISWHDKSGIMDTGKRGEPFSIKMAGRRPGGRRVMHQTRVLKTHLASKTGVNCLWIKN
jgi:hypothetical protein